MSYSKPSASTGRGMVRTMEAVIGLLQDKLKECNESTAKSEAESANTQRGDLELKGFLISELIAAREQIESLKRGRQPAQGNTGTVKPIKNGPCEDPQVVGRIPEDIFPLEVWVMLFNNLTAPSDLAACCNASPLFRKELLAKRAGSEFLFEQVLPILIKNGVFPHNQLSQHLLNLRQICPAWKAGVDSFLENHPCQFHLHEFCTRATNIYTHPSTLIDCFQPSRNYTFSSSQKINECKTLLEGLSSISTFFIGRSITFSQNDPNRTFRFNRQFWLDGKSLLGTSSVGESIWHCKLLNMRSSVAYRLPGLLELMPNLKTLKISFKTCRFLVNRCGYQFCFEQLPKLPQLQVLKVNSWKPVPHFVCQLLETYKGVKKLELEHSTSFIDGFSRLDFPVGRDARNGNPWQEIFSYCHEEVVELRSLLRPNLEALSIPVQSEEGMLTLGRYILNYTPALQNLSLVLSDFTDFRLIFAILENLEKPLKTLSLTLRSRSSSDNNDCKVLQINKLLRLPLLEELTLNVENDKLLLSSVDFILPLNSLRKFTLIRRFGTDKDGWEDQVMDFCRWKTFLFDSKSNIWKLLPVLDNVLIKMVDERGEVGGSFDYERAGLK